MSQPYLHSGICSAMVVVELYLMTRESHLRLDDTQGAASSWVTQLCWEMLQHWSQHKAVSRGSRIMECQRAEHGTEFTMCACDLCVLPARPIMKVME